MEYNDIIVNIRKIIRSINLESKRIQKEYGISIPQLLALNVLQHSHEFQSTHSDLKKALNLNASTVTGIIDRLEKKNLVARLPGTTDKRVTIISLTAKGAELLKNTPQPMQEQLAGKLHDLPEVRLNELKNALDLLVDVLGIQAVDASPLLISDEPVQDIENASD